MLNSQEEKLIENFKIEELEERLETELWGFSGINLGNGATKDVVEF